MARNYSDLEIYQLGYSLFFRIYNLIEKYPENEKDNLISQMRRAVTSVPLNIAEGTSRATKKGYLQFLHYAYGSIRELQVLLDLSKDLKYISIKDYEETFEEVDKLSRKLFVFMRKVEREKFYNWFR